MSLEVKGHALLIKAGMKVKPLPDKQHYKSWCGHLDALQCLSDAAL